MQMSFAKASLIVPLMSNRKPITSYLLAAMLLFKSNYLHVPPHYVSSFQE